jgi:hypothetical protein
MRPEKLLKEEVNRVITNRFSVGKQIVYRIGAGKRDSFSKKVVRII